MAHPAHDEAVAQSFPHRPQPALSLIHHKHNQYIAANNMETDYCE